MSEVKKMIGKNIKKIREKKNFSQAKLANKCGIQVTALSAYENGKRGMSVETLVKIADSLNVTINDLYYGDINKKHISSQYDEGKKIVNSLEYLWEKEIIRYEGPNYKAIPDTGFYRNGEGKRESKIRVNHFNSFIRLMTLLNDFEQAKDTYANPKQYLEEIKTSIAHELNDSLED